MPPITNTLSCREQDEPTTYNKIPVISAASEPPHAEQVHYKFLVVGLTLGCIALAIVISTTIFYLASRFAPARKRQLLSSKKSMYRTESKTTVEGHRRTVLHSIQRWIRQRTTSHKQSTAPVFACKASYDYRTSDQRSTNADWITQPRIQPHLVTRPPPTAIAGYGGSPPIHANSANVQTVAAPLYFSPSCYSRRSSSCSLFTIFQEDASPISTSPISLT
jgi:hypothetical protein